jgi:hypothetical protein
MTRIGWAHGCLQHQLAVVEAQPELNDHVRLLKIRRAIFLRDSFKPEPGRADETLDGPGRKCGAHAGEVRGIIRENRLPRIAVQRDPKRSVSSVGELAFVGFTDPGKAITSVTIVAGQPGTGQDFIGVDDVRFQSAVPEPATWAIMVAGFGGLGALMRSRRRMATASA